MSLLFRTSLTLAFLIGTAGFQEKTCLASNVSHAEFTDRTMQPSRHGGQDSCRIASAPTGPIFYKRDSDEFTEVFTATVRAHAAFLVRCPQARVEVASTSEAGSREYRIAIAQKRADLIEEMLVGLGVDPKQMIAVARDGPRDRFAHVTPFRYRSKARVDFIYSCP